MAVEDRMMFTVSVQYNAAADGSISDEEGVVAPKWTPLPGACPYTGLGFSQVPCLIYEQESQRSPGQDWGEDLTVATFLFPSNVGLPRNAYLRFGYSDPSSGGETVWYYSNGKTTGPAQGASPSRAYVRVMARLGQEP